MSLARFCSLDMHRFCTAPMASISNTGLQIVVTWNKPPCSRNTTGLLLLLLLLRCQEGLWLNLMKRISGKLLLNIQRGLTTSCWNMTSWFSQCAQWDNFNCAHRSSQLNQPSTPDGRLCPKGQLSEQHVYAFLSSLPVLVQTTSHALCIIYRGQV